MDNRIQFEHYSPRWQSSIFQLWSDEISKSWITNPFSYNTDIDFYHHIQRMIDSSFHDFRVVTVKQAEEDYFAGIVFTHDFRTNDGHCKLSVLPNQNMDVKRVLSDFIQWLFREYPLQKVFCEIYGFNKEQIDVCYSLGFCKEADLVDYIYFNGKYHNLVIMGLERTSTLRI